MFENFIPDLRNIQVFDISKTKITKKKLFKNRKWIHILQSVDFAEIENKEKFRDSSKDWVHALYAGNSGAIQGTTYTLYFRTDPNHRAVHSFCVPLGEALKQDPKTE